MIQCIVKNNLTGWYTIWTSDGNRDGPTHFYALSKEAVAFLNKSFGVGVGEFDGGFVYTVYMPIV